jgi:hypothetical protein
MVAPMKRLVPLLALCAACSPVGAGAEPAATATADYATQLTAPAPDYSALIANPPIMPKGEMRREGVGALPADAKAVGETWLERLRAKSALGGYGLAGKGTDGPVNMIDTLLTAREFDAWVKDNGWTAPRYLDWGFQPELVAPAVSERAAPAVRLWTQSEIRTGMTLEALLGGRVVMKDGCLWFQKQGEPDKIAWLHAETGLDRDAEGYLVFVNRVTGETMARLGEEMTWAGPNSVSLPEAKLRDIHQACGKAELFVVGNPQSAERMMVQHPHLRRPTNPPPPAPRPRR